jgi:hypothetical protein
MRSGLLVTYIFFSATYRGFVRLMGIVFPFSSSTRRRFDGEFVHPLLGVP